MRPGPTLKIKIAHVAMKRSGDDGERKTGLMDLPLDLQTEILLIYFEYKIGSVERWHRLQSIFRMIPQFGQTKVKPLFYTKVHYITPDLFAEFYKTMEYPPFLGLREFSPTSYTEEAHLTLVPLMKNLQTLDVSSGSLSGIVKALTNLTSLTCNSRMNDEDLVDMTQLVTLKLSHAGTNLTNETFSRLTRLTSLDTNSCLLGNMKLTPDIFRNLPNLQRLSFRVFRLGTYLPGEFCEAFTKTPTEFANLTSLDCEGDFLVIKDIFLKLPNIVNLRLQAIENYRVGTGHFSTLTRLTNLCLMNTSYHFDDDDSNGLAQLDTLSIQNSFGCRGIDKLTNITNLSIRELDRTSRSVIEPKSQLERLTKLLVLHAQVNWPDSDEVMSKLEGLVHLNVIRNGEITDRSLPKLTNLTQLDVCGSSKLSRNAINRLPKLEVIGVLKKDVVFKKRMVQSLDRHNIKLLAL